MGTWPATAARKSSAPSLMSPDLERLLQALYEKRTCPPEEKAHRNATLSACCTTPWRGVPAQAATNCWTPCMIATKSSAAPDASRLRFRHARKRYPFQLSSARLPSSRAAPVGRCVQEYDNLFAAPLSGHQTDDLSSDAGFSSRGTEKTGRECKMSCFYNRPRHISNVIPFLRCP